jgi:predicted dehydrogenase
VLGEEGGLLKDTGGGGSVKYYHNVAGQQSVTDVPCLETDSSELYANVAAHINDGVELIVNPANVRHTIAIFDAAYESAAGGEAVAPA